MRPRMLLSILALSIFSCKNAEKVTSTSEPKSQQEVLTSSVKDIIVGTDRKPAGNLDFSVLKWSVKRDTLVAIVRYSGGCKTHDFNAHFSGAWLKSLPAQAVIELEHVNLDNDPCRSLVKDTLKFNLAPIQYPGAKEIKVKWAGNSEMMATYRYGKK